ncbi:MAG: protein translocase subunit SecF [Rhodospirillaceae bacterium]|nr:protein translocase subunit SecF [Rhodospirillaceae bacterium]|tara:strand:- start:186 stop:1142 length:957 start_codon:yes stop_codon:yes gene_type:complete
MRPLRVIPDGTHIPFMRWRKIAFVFSLLLGIASVALFFTRGLNYGIDFEGGILVEVQTPGPADLSEMRTRLNNLGLGGVSLQEFGAPNDVLIRVERQPGEEAEQQRAVEAVRAALTEEYGDGVDYRRVEFVGPKVGSELVVAGIEAVVFSVIAMLFYIWFRFEWQFGIGSVVALIHDVVLTIGMFTITGIEFDLATVAAVLLIIGYSMNDTVIVYDRVRENLRKYKKEDLEVLLDRSINNTLARTFNTSFTTLLALFALYFLGGEVIAGFSFTMIWGIAVGTYSSIFIAAPLLMGLNLRRDRGETAEDAAGDKAPASR